MKKNNKGFVVSAVLYPLLVLFLALIMGLLSMSDTRKRILDKMKLEISDSIFDEATCSCDTILNKLNYLIKNGVSGGSGGGGSYTYNVLGLNVKAYEDPSKLPNIGNGIGDIAIITDVVIDSYYVSSEPPATPKHGNVWIVQDIRSPYYVKSDYSKVGINYAMQYICNEEQTECEWQIKKAYVYDEANWTNLYYVPVKDGSIDLEGTDINAEIVKTYEYTGEYQSFTPVFSGYYQIELWGASGRNSSGTNGGRGAYTYGEIYLDAGETIYIYVGGTSTSSVIGWNGAVSGGYAGGGATDVRLVTNSEKDVWNDFESLKSRIMVAAGGGGAAALNASGTYTYYTGSAAGALTGYGDYNGKGATQASPGYNTSKSTDESYVGGFGYGGKGTGVSSSPNYYSPGGGGGGYYGGGGGYSNNSGGGGSSYISGHIGCNSISEDSTETNIISTGSIYHYSGYYFINTIMYDGKTKIPTHDGTSTMTGNNGNGYAKITLKSIEVKEDSELNEKIDNQDTWYYDYASSGTFYSGRYQTFKANHSGTYKIELWGASSRDSSYGGKGGYTSGEIYLAAGTELYVYVGGSTVGGLGGWNGGGTGSSSGGGGATDIRLVNTPSNNTWDDFTSLKSRIMVAGGGGGRSHYYNSDSGSTSYYKGGMAGGIEGIKAATGNSGGPGFGGTQASPGYNFSKSADESYIGGLGYGGNGTNYSSGTNYYYAGGGGGGYYGGGGGYSSSAGGGGSSYISGHVGCSSIAEESLPTNVIHNGSAYHHSGYYFENTEMKSGNEVMTTHDGASTMTGNTGNGYAKVTLLNKETKTEEQVADKIETQTIWHYPYSSATTIYSGRYQIFTVPKNGTYKIEAWGANGRHTQISSSGVSNGGRGGYTSGEIYLEQGTKLYIYVGGQSLSGTGGWNGGGTGNYGGGGATDIRLVNTPALTTWEEFDSLKSRIMVAAGGGGAGYLNASGTGYYYTGGAAGGLIGYSGVNNYGFGGTQASPGYNVSQNKVEDTYIGGFGYGGTSKNYTSGTNYYYAGAGGGGYYGGGGGYQHGTGGGGSSYISGHEECNSIAENSTSTNIIHNGSAYHYSGYYFENTQMFDGKNLLMPTFDGSGTMTGNTEDGYAKITLLKEENKTDSELNEQIENQDNWYYTYSTATTLYSGRYQTFTTLKSGTYKIELWGASGRNSTSTNGGTGAYTSGEITLIEGTTLYVYIGANSLSNLGGWNGGGAGGSHGGGGATDIRTTNTPALTTWKDETSLKTRIMVAAGGGAASSINNNGTASYYTGAAAGGLTGYTGANNYGYGGTQIAGGYNKSKTTTESFMGGLGYGGAGTNYTSGSVYYYSGGGGGGWYGGGGGYQHGTGGGGSSYISGHAGCIAVDSSALPVIEEYTSLADSISYTGYKFVNTQMIDGKGYPWTTEVSTTSTGMPTWDGTSTMTGKIGSGCAKITYLGA